MKSFKFAMFVAVLLGIYQTGFAKYSGGNGTPSNPYIINSPVDLILMAASTEDYTSHFLQTANINLLGTTRTTAFIAPDTNDGADGHQGDKFFGTYDGGGHKIQNFAIDTQGGNQDFLGLFGCLGNNAVVKNLNLENCNIVGGSSSDNCGGICGQNYFNIIDCSVSGSVTGRNNIGGLCGNNNGTISGCYSTANAGGYDNVGGICGYNSGGITNTSAIGTATGHDKVGGLCGYVYQGTINRCYASGQVNGNQYVGGLCGGVPSDQTTDFKESYATGNVYGKSHIGGFIGNIYISGYVTSKINDCFATGNVQATGDYAGGFAGSASRWYNGSGLIERSYAKGNVSGNQYIGGFVGSFDSNCFELCNSYSTGIVIGSSNVGGFSGNQKGSVSNCFWDVDASLLTTSAGGIGKTTAQMQDIQTFIDAGWRISSDVLWYDWYMPVDGYPMLAWEPALKVPSLAGLTQTGADAVIAGQGFSLGQIIYQYNEALAADIVVGQYPASGLNRKPGTPIHLVVTANTPRHYSGGVGTASNPFLIGGINDLLTLANNTSDYHKVFSLITDIDMAAWCLITAVIAPDTSTAAGYQGQAFTGKFNGNGNRILNLTFYADRSGREYTGLFGNLGSMGQISNLIVENGYTDNRWTTNYHGFLCGDNSGTTTGCSASGLIKGGSYVGGICGSNSGSIITSRSQVDILAYDNIGGLCGYNNGSITDNSAIGTVSGRNNIGGLCGYVNKGTITRCYASGQVNGNQYVGGLCGSVPEDQTTNFKESYATGNVYGESRIGGFIGDIYIHGYASSNISDCFAIGDVQATGNYAGGFAGSASRWYNGSGLIERSYAKGNVSGNQYIGGFVGSFDSNGFELCNSYSTGIVIGSSNVGGFSGNQKGSVSNCFWDVDASLLTTSAGGIGKTTAQMQDIQTFIDAGWRISSDVLWYYWYMPVNDYPRLSWEIIAEKVPDVTGLMQPQAMTVITGSQFTVGRILYQYNDQLSVGTVVNQYPTAGLDRAVYEPIDIVVSGLSYPVYSGGTGSTESPYQIADANDLLTLANNPGDWASNFILTADIDLGGWAFTTALISPDTSTSSGYQGTAFEGAFDGNQYIIRNLILYPETSGRGYLGLFGVIGSSGIVHDLGIESFKIDNRWSGDCSGGLCGQNNGTIERCYTIGIMKCSNYSGGLCGNNNGIIDSCYSTINISAGSYAGGLCGQSQSSSIISNSHAVSQIQGGSYVGGFVGNASGGTISASFATGQVSGSERIGGFVGNAGSSGSFTRNFAYVDVNASGSYSGGFIGYSDTASTTQCCAYGDVIGANYAGGFAGYITNSSASISDCYATGWVLGNDYVGGFLGYRSNGQVSRCYSIGSVVGGATAVNVGGFSGYGTSTNCFWDTDSSFMALSSSGTGRTTAQMRDSATYSGAGWSISLEGTTTLWKIAANSYPWLSWEADIYLVPDLVGKTQTNAEYQILDMGYSVGVVSQIFSDTVPAGQVITQYPPAGAVTIPGAGIDLVVSSGLANVPVPYVVGMQKSQAEMAIIYGKLQLCTITYQASAVVPAGSVISQTPAAGTQVPQQSCVDLIVSNGSGGSVVPNLAALTQAEAEDIITGEGFIVGNIILQYSNVVSKGYVISHNPPAGTPAMPGVAVDLVISDGPQPIVVPNLTGMNKYSAIVEVFMQGLTIGIITNQYNVSVAADLVISHSPPAGQTVEVGSAVDLVISLGATPVSVPTVLGLSQSAAVDALIAAGLFIGQITEEYNDIVAHGLVFSQSPLQGAAVPQGTAVDLWVSKGPHQLTVPNAIGLTLETAVATILNADLAVGSLMEQYSEDVAVGVVISQSPDAETIASSGSAVDLIISKGSAPCAKPHWSAPYAANVMVIYAKVKVNGTEITTADSMLGGFIAGVPVGYSDVENRPTGVIYQLVITSQNTSGQITFRIFDSLDCKVYVISGLMDFVPGGVVGSLLNPVLLEAFEIELRADINRDGTVNLLDLVIMAEEWMMPGN